MTWYRNVVLVIWIVSTGACNAPEEKGGVTLPTGNLQEQCQDLGEGWSVPKSQVVGGGVGKDGIPSIDNPEFVSVGEVEMRDDEIVIGVSVNGELHAYPHRILESHEIVNDFAGNEHFSVTFCPLTGTSLTWHRDEDNTFGVSGFLFNSNLIAYDRKTDSNWAQIYSRGINGENICNATDYVATIEMNWATWRELFPDSKVLSRNTGFNRNYAQPAEGYNQPVDAIPIFPVENIDNRLPLYERVLLVVVDGSARAYRLSSFGKGPSMSVDFLAGKQVTLVGSQEKNFVVPYLNGLIGLKNFGLDKGKLIDSEGNIYNLFGEAVEGPDKGEQLEIPYSMMGYWFAIAAFYPDVDIYVEGEF